MAPPPRFAVELPDGTLAHFTLGGAGGPGDADGPGNARLAELLGPPGCSYSVVLEATEPGGGCGARVHAARLHQRLLRQLRHGPFQRCQVRRLLCYSPGGRADGAWPGILLRDPLAGPDTRAALLELLRPCGGPARPQLAEFQADSRGALWRRHWDLQGDTELPGSCTSIVPVPAPGLHPAVPDLPSSAVFPSREAARAVLEACTFIPEAQAVLSLVDRCPKQVQKGKFPVIVIEGLDATGKTTVTRSLSESLNAVLLQSPPSSLGQWRKIFDDEPNIIRRAFYSLGNYIVASEIADMSTRSPVIVDRYWHSTATYAIATEVSGGLQHLPPAHHPVYQWPEDLLKPDLVLLLTVSPEVRAQRLQGRGLEKTREEVELEANSVFRQK
ncbi:UMP-CMP kinase 2, mitochondrial [Ctenodactylus gundi]